eukprot:scaffold38715_cov31-Tisochrysis_lutea.AAC.4
MRRRGGTVGEKVVMPRDRDDNCLTCRGPRIVRSPRVTRRIRRPRRFRGKELQQSRDGRRPDGEAHVPILKPCTGHVDHIRLVAPGRERSQLRLSVLEDGGGTTRRRNDGE